MGEARVEREAIRFVGRPSYGKGKDIARREPPVRENARTGNQPLWTIPTVHAETSPTGWRGTHACPVVTLRQREAVQNFTHEQVSLRRR